jgi:hemin uptake protein HemP
VSHRQETQQGDASRGGPARTAAAAEQVLDSRTLFRDRTEIQIRHEGELYRLRLTRNGRLILNK